MSDMDHVSPNHANALLVRNQPPIPTVSPSAQASAAARQGNNGGKARGTVGVLAKHLDSQLRQALLSLRRVTVGEFGSEILTHVGLCDAGTAGRSALQRTGFPEHSITLASVGIHSPGMVRVARPVESKLDRKDCHVEAETEYMLPGGLCKSEYNGASQGRKCLEMLVAQISRPRHCSRALRGTLWAWLKFSSC